MFHTNEELKRYDTIVGTVVANVFAEAGRTENKVYLKDFNPSNPSHRVYYYGALIGATIFKDKAYLNMPLYKYVWFKLTHWKARKQIQHISSKKIPPTATKVQAIMDYIEEFYSIEEDKSIWQEILDAYYEPKKGVEEE